MQTKKWVAPVVIALILIIDVFLGIPRLKQFDAVDEPYWTYDRTPQFWNSIKNRKWKSTNINDKPGITAALISGAGLISVNPLDFKTFRQKPKSPDIVQNIEKINFYMRLPIFLVGIFSLLLFFFFIKKLLGETIALFSVILIGLSPIIFGISLIINPDSLLWIFLPLTIISFMVFQRQYEKKYLYFSGIFLGLALLTKYVANILYVYIFGLIFLDYIFSRSNETKLAEYLKKNLLNYLILCLVSVATFFILFPATWVHPKMVLEGTFLSKAFKSTWPLFVAIIGLILADLYIWESKALEFILKFFARHKRKLAAALGSVFVLAIIFVLIDVWSGMRFLNLEPILASPKSSDTTPLSLGFFSGKILADYYSLIFGLTPLAFLSFFAVLFVSLKEKEYKIEERAVIYILIFVILYFIASTVNHVTATVRYQIALYPLVSILSAIGFYRIIGNKKVPRILAGPAVFFLLLIISFYSLLSVKPHYFSYASSLLPSKYILNFKDMGDGSYEIAQYLNRSPDAQSLVIWSDKGAVCEAFIGRCLISYTRKDLENVTFDYYVTSLGRKSKSMKMSTILRNTADFNKLYSVDYYNYKIILGGRENNFVKVTSQEKARL